MSAEIQITVAADLQGRNSLEFLSGDKRQSSLSKVCTRKKTTQKSASRMSTRF